MKFKIAIVCVSIIVLLGLFVYQRNIYFDGKLHVVFCDVGQGDGIFIRTPSGADLLIDAGPSDKIIGCLERHMPFWDRSIELAFATHPDADHITGFEYVLKAYEVKSFNTSRKTSDTKVFKEIQRLIAEKKIPLKFIFQSDKYTTGDGVELLTDWPSRSYVSNANINTDTNSFSLVQLLSYGKFTMLFTGDVEKEILERIFARGLNVDVIKLPHHGSKTGADLASFKLIKSDLGILSVGLKNRYGHPSPEVIALLKEFHQRYKSTAASGDIEIISNGKNYALKNQ